MHPRALPLRLLLLFAALPALGCAGSIPGNEEPPGSGGSPSPSPASGGRGPGVGGAGGAGGGSVPMATAGSGGPTPAPGGDLFAFRCADPATGEARPLRRLSREELRQHLISALAGTSLGSGAAGKVDLAMTSVPDDLGDPQHFAEEVLHTTDGHVQALLNAAESLATTVAALTPADHDLLSAAKCKTPATALDACAQGLADELGLRLFRRPLAAADVAKLKEQLAMAGVSTPAAAVSTALSYLFLLPPSLLHVEDGGELVRGGEGVRISPFEAMNRVHFGLLGTPAPVTLLKAMKGADWTRAKGEQRIDEILASSAFKSRLTGFFQAWLGFGPSVDLTGLPSQLLGGIARAELSGEAYEELRAFVNATVFGARGTVTDLLLSNQVHWLGPNIAKVYGLPAPAAKGPLAMPAALDDTKFGGILSRAAMNLHGEPQTSPIGRGVRVKRKLYCEDIHPPPDLNIPGAEVMELADLTKHSNRAITENRTSPPLCMVCHKTINQIGFALDFYDSVGRYRTEEVRYDAKGTVVNTFPLATDVGTPVAVAKEIADAERGSACFVNHWLSFTAQSDKYGVTGCLKRALHERVRTGGAGILEMIRQAARSELDAVKDLRRQP